MRRTPLQRRLLIRKVYLDVGKSLWPMARARTPDTEQHMQETPQQVWDGSWGYVRIEYSAEGSLSFTCKISLIPVSGQLGVLRTLAAPLHPQGSSNRTRNSKITLRTRALLPTLRAPPSCFDPSNAVPLTASDPNSLSLRPASKIERDASRDSERTCPAMPARVPSSRRGRSPASRSPRRPVRLAPCLSLSLARSCVYMKADSSGMRRPTA